MSELSAENPVALITGAAKRMGRAIALHLARQGYSMALHYHHSAAEAQSTRAECEATARAAGYKASRFVTLQADLADENAMRSLLPQAVEALGQVDALVNNAALFDEDTAASLTYASMERHWRSNTGAPVLLAHALYTHVQERAARGCVVNLLDQKLWNQNPDFFSYTLSKAALEAANTMLALALAPAVRVVGVAPGLTLTSHLLSEAAFAQLHTLSPLQRSSTPEDIAAAVAFALQNQAVTGTTLLVDGGQHLMRFERDFSKMV